MHCNARFLQLHWVATFLVIYFRLKWGILKQFTNVLRNKAALARSAGMVFRHSKSSRMSFRHIPAKFKHCLTLTLILTLNYSGVWTPTVQLTYIVQMFRLKNPHRVLTCMSNFQCHQR